MRSNIALAAVLARIAAAAPAPQQFDFAAILNAPSPTATGPPVSAVAATSTTFTVDIGSIAASISEAVTTVATASITGSSASAASTQDPADSALDKRRLWPLSTLSLISKLTLPSTSTVQQSSTSTTSSSTACPTVPEAGTYCGFINPEDPCAVQPAGSGPQLDALAAITPQGYVNTFKDLNASTSANSYLTYETLTSYNVSGCAAFCDNVDLCTAFNIYIERDPSLNPTSGDASNGTYCPNPASITNYKCSLWGSSIDASSATNYGTTWDEFQVVIAGSNGYDKINTTPPTQPGWSQPSHCTSGAISSGGSYWMGSNFYPGPFDPSVCSIYAQAQTNENMRVAQQQGASSYTPCNMFNVYMIKKNGVPQGTYCALFDTVLSDSWAAFQGSWSGPN